MSPPSSTTLVCFALKEEAAPFRQTPSGDAATILITGIGRANARKVLEAQLAKAMPARVLTCGFAGALNPELKIGDLVGETGDPALAAKLTAIGVCLVKIHCADRIAITAAEKRQLREQTGAGAVEMESAAIHGICRERHIPCATLRVISDLADEDLPLDFNQFSKPDASLDLVRLLAAVARSPGKISGLLRLQRQAKLAAQKLAAALPTFTTQV